MATVSSQPTLHHLNNSQSQRVLWLIEELGISYNLVNHSRQPGTHLAPISLCEATPFGKSPTLITAEGDAIIESSAIIGYLVRTYDLEHKFNGAGAGAGGHNDIVRDEVLTSFISTTLEPMNTCKLLISTGALTDNTGGAFIEPRIVAELAYLEDALGEQDYLMGPNPARPDFMLSWPLDMIVQCGYAELPPRLKAWRERVLARDAWKRALAKPGVPYELTSFRKK